MMKNPHCHAGFLTHQNYLLVSLFVELFKSIRSRGPRPIKPKRCFTDGSQQSGLLLFSRARFLSMKATHFNYWIILCLSVAALPAYGATCIEFYPAEKVGEFESGEISESSINGLADLSHAPRPTVDAQ